MFTIQGIIIIIIDNCIGCIENFYKIKFSFYILKRSPIFGTFIAHQYYSKIFFLHKYKYLLDFVKFMECNIFDENYTTQKNKSYQYLLSDGVGCNCFSEKVTALDVTWITGKV